MKVLIADDHAMITQALSKALGQLPGFSIAISCDFQSTIETVESSGPFDVIMLDVKMPGMYGLESVRKLVQIAKNGKVVLFTGNAEVGFVQGAIDVGAYGIIPKSLPLGSLASALGLVKSGEVFIPSSMSQSMQETQPTKCALSDLEKRVLKMVSEGSTNKEIARDIQSSEMTVKMHMRTICTKLKAKNRTHAVVLARELEEI